jgi:hypothetical protein
LVKNSGERRNGHKPAIGLKPAKLGHPEENLGAARVQLTAAEVAEIESGFAGIGTRDSRRPRRARRIAASIRAETQAIMKIRTNRLDIFAAFWYCGAIVELARPPHPEFPAMGPKEATGGGVFFPCGADLYVGMKAPCGR